MHELLVQIAVEPSNLSQQLAVLRRAGLVVSAREGSTVVYTLSTPDVADLMRVARRILTAVIIDNQGSLLHELQAEAEAR